MKIYPVYSELKDVGCLVNIKKLMVSLIIFFVECNPFAEVLNQTFIDKYIT